MSALCDETLGLPPVATPWMQRKSAVLVALFVCLSVLLRHYIGNITDVSWLIIVCEKMLTGQQLYVDIIETNPPFSIAIYLGPVWLSHHIGLSAEATVELYVYLLWALSMGLTAMVVERSPLLSSLEKTWLYPVLTALLLVFPGGSFGQREHIGMMMFMPMLAMMMWRADSRGAVPVPLALAVVTGLAASVIVLVKPHWALAIAFPYAVICWRRKSLRACLTPENVVIGLVATSYLVIVLQVFDVYTRNILPLLLKYYVPFTSNVSLLLAGPTFMIFAGFIIVQQRMSVWRTEVIIALASASGFFVAMVYLGKYWNYHQFPYLVVLSMAMLMAIATRKGYIESSTGGQGQASGIRTFSIAAIMAVAAFGAGLQIYPQPEPQMVAAIHARFKNPTIIQVSNDLAAGNPLTRLVHGRWLSRYAHDWIGANALRGVLGGEFQGAARDEALKTLDGYTAYLNGLIQRERPDIILLNRLPKKPMPPLWVAWMLKNARFQKLIAGYDEIFVGARTRVFARRSAEMGGNDGKNESGTPVVIASHEQGGRVPPFSRSPGATSD